MLARKDLYNFLNEKQQEFCFSKEPFLRLLAPAGSGKTASLLWRCLDQSRENINSKFLLFTFTRVARDEIRLRLATDANLASLQDKVRVETLNAWGNSYLQKQKSHLVLKTSKLDYMFLIKNNLRPLWEDKIIINRIEDIYGPHQHRVIDVFSELKTLGFRHNIERKLFFLEFANHYEWLQQKGLDSYFTEKITRALEDMSLVDESKSSELSRIEKFVLFWKKSTEELWKQAIITLEDQKYWALNILEENYPKGKLFPSANRYQHILIDEFQDINPLDLALAKKLQEVNKSTLAIVGDDDQAIYEWRGSSPKFIVKPDEFFDQKFSTVVLNTNYRSPKNIVYLSQKLISNNKNRVDKNIVPASTQDAVVQVKHFKTHVDSLNFILEETRKLNGTKEKIAVISRKKGQLIPLQILLTSEEMDFYAKEDLNVLLSKAFHDLQKLLTLHAQQNDRKESSEVVNNILALCDLVKKYPLSRQDKQNLRTYLLKSRPKSLRDALITLSVYDGTIKRLSPESFVEAITEVLDTETVSTTIETIGSCFEGLQKHYAKSEDDIFYKEPPFLYMSDYAQRYEDDYWGFMDHVGDAVAKMEDEKDSDAVDLDLLKNVHLMTALRAKGKEFEHVIILDVNDGLWPIKFAETEEQLEQERRLFYVAVTRTKKKLSLITVDCIHDKKVYKSPYLKEMGVI